MVKHNLYVDTINQVKNNLIEKGRRFWIWGLLEEIESIIKHAQQKILGWNHYPSSMAFSFCKLYRPGRRTAD